MRDDEPTIFLSLIHFSPIKQMIFIIDILYNGVEIEALQFNLNKNDFYS